MENSNELLVGLSDGELEALAESSLAPGGQSHLSDLLARNSANGLSAAERSELERILDQVDQLTLLKTRARFTLTQRAAAGQT